MTDAASQSPQRTIGAYRLIARIGTGGMAEVYLALSSKGGGFNKLLVLKVMREEVSNDPEFRTMFLDEASIAARLSHPNVINVFEVGEENGRFFIAMEYVEGQSFAALLKRTNRKPEHRGVYLRILCDTLVGLHHAHELTDYDGSALEVVHRDVSPPNVLVSFGGHAKVVDFGIAKVAGSSGQTKTGILKGKVGFMAPEQVRGEAVDRRADIFAVGVMLWEILAGRPLVTRTDSEVAALSRRLRGDPKVADEVPDVPPELAAICDRAIALEPADRYATALEMHADLEAQLAKVPHSDAKAVAALLVEQFAAERKSVKALIEEQINITDRTQRLNLSEPSLPLIHMSPEEASGANRSRPTGATSTAAAVVTPSEPPVASTGRGRPLLLIGGVALAVAAAAGIYTVSRPAETSAVGATPAASSAAAPPAAPSVASAEPAHDAAVAPTTVELTVKTTPATAAVTIDGRPMSALKPHALPRGVTHRLLVSAPGFVTFERTLELDKDETLDVALTRATFVGGPAPKRPAGPTAAPTPAAPAPKPDDAPLTKKPRRTIDDENPYGH